MGNPLPKAPSQKKLAVIGAVTLLVMIALLGAVIGLARQDRRETKVEYEKAEAVLYEVISGNREGCAQKIRHARDQMKGQIKRAGPSKFMMDKKAVIYDKVLKDSMKICTGHKPDPPDPNIECKTPEDCATKAFQALFAGKYKQAGALCRAGLGEQESAGLRELLGLCKKLEQSASKP